MIDERTTQLLKRCLQHKLENNLSQYAQAVGSVLSTLTIAREEANFGLIQKILLDINLGRIKTDSDLADAFQRKERAMYVPLKILHQPVKELIKNRRTKLYKLDSVVNLEIGPMTYLKLVQIDDVWGLTSICVGTKIRGLTVLSQSDLLKVLKITQGVPSIQYIKINDKVYNEAVNALNA